MHRLHAFLRPLAAVAVLGALPSVAAAQTVPASGIVSWSAFTNFDPTSGEIVFVGFSPASG